MQLPIYLDHNATTPLDTRVLDAMLPYLQQYHGNPSSGHGFGLAAKDALATAREQVAALVNVHPSQVIFTSGGTEANNLAIKGVAAKSDGPIVVSAVEHASVTGVARTLKSTGRDVRHIDVDSNGLVSLSMLANVFDEKQKTPSLVSVMMVNNETGAVQDIVAIAGVLQDSETVLHTDAVQAAGKIEIDFNALGVDLMSLSSHKIYGPKGVGALVVNKSVDRESLMHGGSQENGCRAGTENVAGIVGFGMAAELAKNELDTRSQHILKLREKLEQDVKQAIPECIIFAEAADRIPNTTFMAVPGIDGETLLINLDQAGLAIASGSACESASLEPSHVLMAMGVEQGVAQCAIRISLGKDNTVEEIDYFVGQLKQHVQMLQNMVAVASF